MHRRVDAHGTCEARYDASVNGVFPTCRTCRAHPPSTHRTCPWRLVPTLGTSEHRCVNPSDAMGSKTPTERTCAAFLQRKQRVSGGWYVYALFTSTGASSEMITHEPSRWDPQSPQGLAPCLLRAIIVSEPKFVALCRARPW
jgi:hypothetical protein